MQCLVPEFSGSRHSSKECRPDSVRQVLPTAPSALTGGMWEGKIVLKLGLFAILQLMVFAPTGTQAQDTVEITGYTHGTCLVDGKKLRPKFADDGLRTTTHVNADWNCEDVINSGILGCKSAVRHIYDRDDQKYPKCREIFESWVPGCIAHYENQRGKCEQAILMANEASGKSDSPDCKYAKQVFSGYESACNSGDSNACGILPQASDIVKQTCR